MRCISFILFVSARKVQGNQKPASAALTTSLPPARNSADSGTAASAPDVSSFPGSYFLLRRGILAIKLPQLFCLSVSGISDEDRPSFTSAAGRGLAGRRRSAASPLSAAQYARALSRPCPSSSLLFCRLFLCALLHFSLSPFAFPVTLPSLPIHLPLSRSFYPAFPSPIGTQDVSNRFPSPPGLLRLESHRFAGQKLTGILTAVAGEALS